MIHGTGPGRGVPWWRWGRSLTLMRYWQPTNTEVLGRPREGRTVAVVGRAAPS